jgi:hypothetical protein
LMEDECYVSKFNGMRLDLVDPRKAFINIVTDYVINSYRYDQSDPASPDMYDTIDKLIGRNFIPNLGINFYNN